MSYKSQKPGFVGPLMRSSIFKRSDVGSFTLWVLAQISSASSSTSVWPGCLAVLFQFAKTKCVDCFALGVFHLLLLGALVVRQYW
jgi:hypothetical protein